MPLERAQGRALLEQGIAEIQDVADRLTADGVIVDAELATLRGFRDRAAEFRQTLVNGLPTGPDGAIDARQRVVFFELERAADRLDQQCRTELRAFVASLDRGLHRTITIAVGLLLLICAVVLWVGRRQARAVAALRASEDRLRTMIANLSEGVVITDADGRLLQWNRVASQLLEDDERIEPMVHVDEVAARFTLCDENDEPLPRESSPLRRLLRGERVQDQEVTVKRRGATSGRTLRCSGAMVRDAEGARFALLSFTDVTERRRNQRALRDEKERLDRITQTSPGVVHSFRLAPDGRASFPFATERLAAIYGVPAQLLAVDAASVFAGMHPEDADAARTSIAASRRAMVPWWAEFRYRHPDRGELWIEANSMPVPDPDGGCTWHGVLTEVTERKQVEARLREQERLLQQMGHIAQVGGWEFDTRTGAGTWTPEVARIHDLEDGVETSRAMGMQFFPPGARERIEAAVQNAIDHAVPYELELPFVSAKGVHKWVRTIGQPVLEAGQVVRLRGAFMDITARKEAENLARLQHAVTQALAESSTPAEAGQRVMALVCEARKWRLGALWLVDRCKRWLRCAAVHTSGDGADARTAAAARELQLAAGQDLPGRVVEQVAPVWGEAGWHERSPRRAALEHDGLSGGVALPLCDRSGVIGAMEFLTGEVLSDEPGLAQALAAIGTQVGGFLERRRFEEQFRQAQKMEAIGTLAGGIAHDFNNILTVILGHANMARIEAAGQPRIEESIATVLAAAGRATDLVKQILTFSRPQEPERRVVVLDQVLREASQLLRAMIPSSVEFRSTLAADAPPVRVDVTQVHQVVMNLCTNAVHAMQGRSGQLDIVLERHEVDDATAAAAGLRVGTHARLSIRDTGHGMDAATLERIFEPFFSTKRAGEGTGLGLAVVHGIMQAHQGGVVVHSRPGEGSRFDLYFPAAPTAPSRIADGAPRQAPRSGQGQRILMIDDEDSISRLGQRVLESLGYRVEAVDDARTGWARFVADPSGFDLVITDLTMPGLDGLELARLVGELRPGVPVILTTGLPGSVGAEQAQAAGVSEVLYKPISIEQLGESVRQALAGDAAAMLGEDSLSRAAAFRGASDPPAR